MPGGATARYEGGSVPHVPALVTNHNECVIHVVVDTPAEVVGREQPGHSPERIDRVTEREGAPRNPFSFVSSRAHSPERRQGLAVHLTC